MGTLDLTTFGFTPTESLIYEVLLRGGPGTGYAVARAAGLARANAYGALEGLVQKGVARVEEGRPKRYRRSRRRRCWRESSIGRARPSTK